MHSLYRIDTGELTGQRSGISDELRLKNTPPGHAWIEGEHDPRTCAVVQSCDEFGELCPGVIRRLPDKPADSIYQVWVWDAATYDWKAVPTMVLEKARACEPILAQFKPLDDALARPVGEVTRAVALGQAAPAGAVQRLNEIEASKEALRGRMAAINACTSAAQLKELLATWEAQTAG